MSKRRPLLGSNSGILGDVPTPMPNPYISPATKLLNPLIYQDQLESTAASSLLGDGPIQKQPKLSTVKPSSSSSLLGDGPPSMEKRSPLIQVSDPDSWGYGEKTPKVQQSTAQPISDISSGCGSFMTSAAPLITTDQPTCTKLKVDEDTNFLKLVGNKLRDAFNSKADVSIASESPLNSILLDGEIVYRNEQHMINYEKVNLQILALNSDKLTNQTLTIQNGFPEKRIIGLPIELNPAAIHHCLSYLHGNSINLNGSLGEELVENVSKIYITALYLDLNGLVSKINGLLNSVAYSSLKQGLDFPGMNEFVKSLPSPELFSVNPVEIDELPCGVANKQK